MNFRRFGEYLPQNPRAAVQTAAAGFAAGIVYWILYVVLQRYVVTPLLCNALDFCGVVDPTALWLAILLAHGAALVALVRLRVLRPLLVVIASVVTLWGLQVWIGDISWWLAGLYSGVAFMFAYSYYSWANRLLRFPVALVVTVASIAVIRLLLAGW